MRKLLYKIEQFTESGVVNLHWHMPEVEHNTVLVIIYIRRILKSPLTAVNGHRNNPVILPGRIIDPARIPLVLPAQQAFGIS